MSTWIKLLHLENIPSIIFRLLVFHLLTSSSTKLLQPLNIYFIVVTLLTFHSPKFKFFKEIHPLNIQLIFVALLTFQFLIPSIFLKLLQLSNIPCIFVTLLTSSFSTLILVIFVKLLNKCSESVGAYTSFNSLISLIFSNPHVVKKFLKFPLLIVPFVVLYISTIPVEP